MTDNTAAPRARRRAAVVLPALDLSPLTCHVGFLLRLAQQQMIDEFHRSFGHAGLTTARYCVLALLQANPNVQQGRVAEALRIKPSNMAVLLAEMEAEGLVHRQVDSSNRRANLLRLTVQGLTLYEKLTPDVLAMEERVAQPLNAHEYATLIMLLARMTPA